VPRCSRGRRRASGVACIATQSHRNALGGVPPRPPPKGPQIYTPRRAGAGTSVQYHLKLQAKPSTPQGPRAHSHDFLKFSAQSARARMGNVRIVEIPTEITKNRLRGGFGRTCLSVAGRGPWTHFNLRHLRVQRGVSRYCGDMVAFGVNCAEKHQNYTVEAPKTSIKTPKSSIKHQKSSIKTPEKQSESIVNAPKSSIKALIKCI